MEKPETKDFFECLFDKDEWTCFANENFKQNNSAAVDEWILFNHLLFSNPHTIQVARL